VVGRRRCAEWSGGPQAVIPAWAAGRQERRRGSVDCWRVRGACAAGWPEVRRVVLLLLLVMRRSCGCGAWCIAATRGVSLLVCCFRHAEYKPVLFMSGSPNVWDTVGVSWSNTYSTKKYTEIYCSHVSRTVLSIEYCGRNVTITSASVASED
jgi:hypothetical protein